MNLSIVVCTKDDMRIQQLLESIDEDCEVVVVCNGSTSVYRNYVRELLKKTGLHFVMESIPKPSLSTAREIGTCVASSDKVVHIDTDCVFTKGALAEYDRLLDVYPAVNGLVRFDYSDRQSKIVADMRSFGLPGMILCPSIGFRKEIRDAIGDHFFDSRLTWIEDSEFNVRLSKANIPIHETDGLTCIHEALTFRRDLISAFRYGEGVRIAASYNLHKKRPTANWFLIPPMYRISFLHGVYALVWNVVYCIGFYSCFDH